MSPNRSFSRTQHWTIAACVLGALVTGYVMTRSGSFSLPLLQVHLGAGALAGLLSIARVLIWIVWGAPPPVYQAASRIQGVASRLVHGLLRLVPLALLASGAAMIALSGTLPSITGGSLTGITAFENLPPRNLHHAAALLLAVLIGLHAGAAVWHWRDTSETR